MSKRDRRLWAGYHRSALRAMGIGHTQAARDLDSQTVATRAGNVADKMLAAYKAKFPDTPPAEGDDAAD